MKDDRVYLAQILDAAEKIREFVAGMDNAAFLQLALIGEFAKRVSAPARASIDIPWKEIAGFRDRAIHDYFQIDLQIAWDTIVLDLEPLTKTVQEYLEAHR